MYDSTMNVTATFRYLPPSDMDTSRYGVTVGQKIGPVIAFHMDTREYVSEVDARLFAARYRGNNLNMIV
jgi:hypothetical protein